MTLERPRVVTQEEPLSYRKEKERSRALSRVYKILRNFMIAGLLIGGYGKTTEIVFEHQAQTYYQEVERLKKIEQELNETFGTNNPLPLSEKIADMEKVLKEEKRHRYVNPTTHFTAPRIVECPFCNRYHSSSHLFCPYYGLSLAPEAIKKAKEEKAERERVLEITDIETRDGKIRREQIKEYLDTLPEGWASPSVRSIIQTEKEYNSSYGGRERFSALASCDKSTDRAEIKFYMVVSRNNSLSYAVSAIGHEVAHANDWDNKRINFKSRLNLLMKMTKRIKANDRYKSAYVESIREDDPRKTNYTRSVEYWATISEQYFSSPWELSIEDFLIVDNFVKETNPSYNWKKSFEDRLKVIEKVRQGVLSPEDNPSFTQNDTPSFQNQ